MAPSYAQFYGGAALVSFVWEIGGVKVYNDLVKVWVDRSDLRVTGLDANNYLSSHCERRLPEPEISEAEARALVSNELEIDAVSLALIPISPSVEALCFELHGFFGGGEYAVYVNAVTGAEERIFRIVSENGGKAAV